MEIVGGRERAENRGSEIRDTASRATAGDDNPAKFEETWKSKGKGKIKSKGNRKRNSKGGSKDNSKSKGKSKDKSKAKAKATAKAKVAENNDKECCVCGKRVISHETVDHEQTTTRW